MIEWHYKLAPYLSNLEKFKHDVLVPKNRADDKLLKYNLLDLICLGYRHIVEDFLLSQDNTFFDVEVHANTFIAYCELILFPDGHCEYAVPSHEQKLVQVYARQRNMSVDDIMKMLREYKGEFAKIRCKMRHLDATDKIMLDTGCMYVWYDSCHNICKPTKEQMKTLSRLISHGCVSDSILNDIS